MRKILIVGINSYIGSNLSKYFKRKNFEVYGTTNKKIKTNKKNIYLNLKKPKFNFINTKIDFAIICASITNIQKCESAPVQAKIVNVTNTIKLIEYLNSKSIFTLYISSNLVFSGKKSFNNIKEKTNPISKYGKYKLLVEKFIKSRLYKNYSILRLTKVISDKSELIKKLKKKIKQKKYISYEKDYFISPIKIEKVCIVIFKLLINKNNGIFQLGGKKEYNLNDFIKVHLKKKNYLIKNLNKKKTKWKNYKNSLETFLPFKV